MTQKQVNKLSQAARERLITQLLKVESSVVIRRHEWGTEYTDTVRPEESCGQTATFIDIKVK